jgi:hypothetical protein
LLPLIGYTSLSHWERASLFSKGKRSRTDFVWKSF